MDLQKIFLELEILGKDSLIMLSSNDWKDKVTFPSRVIRLLEDTEKWSPKAIFYFDNKPLILFFENPENKKELHKAVWNFNEAPIVIISENDTVSVYNGFAINENTELLKELGGEEILNDFNYFELVTGKTFEKYNEEFNHKTRVDYKLLENIEETQKEIQRIGFNSRVISNALLGKVIFIRYLIDRKVKLNFDGVSREWKNQEFCDLLLDRERVYRFFDYLQHKDKGFNGNLFPIEKDSFDAIPNKAFELIKSLLEGGEIKTGQQSLFQLYDFSVLPIEFISNVYERFIGKENQAEAGAYYTPTFLVDYIISQTVAKKLNANDNSVSCKVLDPACGSGIFLVESLRKIIEKHIALFGISDDKQAFKEVLKKLAQENIFGIDKDESAVQVAIFSIYLTLLDYQKPAEIENFKFPTLLNTNFFVADFFETEPTDKTKADFNIELKKRSFDFILGNPPWAGAKKGLDTVGKNYIKQRKKDERKLKKEFQIGINNNEIAEGFVLRASDFCNPNTQTVFIIRSSILYNLGYSEESPFRPYWLQDFFIDRVFELAPVRHEVFDRSNDPAIAPAAIVFYRYANGENTDKNIVEHITLKPSRFFSIFKIFTINRSDYKRVEQSKLKQYDWLWKTLVYGSYLDFNFLKRIKEENSTILNVLSDGTKFIEGTGIQYSSSPKDNAEHLKGYAFLDSYGVEAFFINPDKISGFDKPMVHRIRNDKPMIFKAPMLLIREGIELSSLKARCAISTRDILFKDSITSVKVFEESNVASLCNIASVFNSSLFSYFAVTFFSSIGIERERVKNYNKFSLPYIELDVQKDIEDIEKAKKALHTKKKNGFLNGAEIERDSEEISEKLESLDKKVLQKLDLSDCEKELIDYALNVSKFMFIGTNRDKAQLYSLIKSDDSILQDYAQLFLNRFQSNLSNNERKFIVEIWHTNQIIGMFFKVIPINEYTEDIKWENKQSESAIINIIIKLGAEKITDQLFVQKDVRGFEKDYFYIFKPNEKRLWHKAIGYLDVNEFADAILKAGRDSK
jgi:hypothetical protein